MSIRERNNRMSCETQARARETVDRSFIAASALTWAMTSMRAMKFALKLKVPLAGRVHDGDGPAQVDDRVHMCMGRRPGRRT